MGDRDAPDALDAKADCTYRPEFADLERVGTCDMRDHIVGNDKRVFTTNRLLLRSLCTIIRARFARACGYARPEQV